MKQSIFTIWKNNAIISGVHKLTLFGDTSAITRPGQFADVQVDGHFLRRPFSVCDWDKDTLVLVYRLIGQGTRDLAAKRPGEGLDILTGLGNGFDTSLSGDHPLLVAGGSGVPMMLSLTKQLVREGKSVTALLGYRTVGDIFMDDDIRAAGANVIVTTEDGSYGRKGMVTDVMGELDYSYFYTCGPEAMFRAVDAVATTSGQFSFEARMGCGYGACMGCTCQTKYGAKRICKDGPVLTREEIVW